jgi:hypothetical protein
MNQNVRAAMERLEEAAYRAQTLSRQPRFGDKPGAVFGSFLKWYKKTEADIVPPYAADSRKRDAWLNNVWREEPHLNGVVNSVVSIDKNRAWALTGGRNQTARYNNILRTVEDGEGWRFFMSKASESFYTSDLGTVTEVGRDAPGGPARAFYHVDSQRCKLTGNRNNPLEYHPSAGGDMQTWAQGDYFRTVSLPSTNEKYNGLGYCAVSRVWTLVQLMMAVYEHDLEKLGARAPKGLLLLQNISEQQWDDAMKAREANLTQRERDWFGGVATLAQEGVDQIDAKLVALSQLPDGFDLEKFTQLLMYGIALCFAYDPIEFWPVNAGALGRGRETEIQHMKATGKGGLDFILSFQDRLQRELPPTLLFEFEQRDVAGELKDAEVAKAWADVFAVYASSRHPRPRGGAAAHGGPRASSPVSGPRSKKMRRWIAAASSAAGYYPRMPSGAALSPNRRSPSCGATFPPTAPTICSAAACNWSMSTVPIRSLGRSLRSTPTGWGVKCATSSRRRSSLFLNSGRRCRRGMTRSIAKTT